MNDARHRLDKRTNVNDSTASTEKVESVEVNPPLPDPGPRDGTHTHDGVSPTDPDVGEAFADGFQHPQT